MALEKGIEYRQSISSRVNDMLSWNSAIGFGQKDVSTDGTFHKKFPECISKKISTPRNLQIWRHYE
jgi:hypothetical protein